jgi:hypothetical protein
VVLKKNAISSFQPLSERPSLISTASFYPGRHAAATSLVSEYSVLPASVFDARGTTETEYCGSVLNQQGRNSINSTSQGKLLNEIAKHIGGSQYFYSGQTQAV